MPEDNTTTDVVVDQPEQPAEPVIEPVNGVDWSKINPADIPAEIVKATGLYRDVLGESIKRRETITELKKQLQPAPDGSAPSDEIKQLRDVVEKLVTMQAVQQEHAERVQVAVTNGLPASAAKYITGSTSEELAASVAELKKLFSENSIVSGDAVSPGAPGTPTDPNAGIRARMLAQIKGDDIDPFDVGFQRQAGGKPMV